MTLTTAAKAILQRCLNASASGEGVYISALDPNAKTVAALVREGLLELYPHSGATYRLTDKGRALMEGDNG